MPHALEMTATRTAIAIGIADPSIPWGDGRVQVVALVAFSETDREAFQTVFEQFVEVFSERESVQRIVRRGDGLQRLPRRARRRHRRLSSAPLPCHHGFGADPVRRGAIFCAPKDRYPPQTRGSG